MSKRPNTGPKPLSGARSLVGFLRDRRIGVKLGFILFVPTLAILIVGANGLIGQLSTERSAERTRTLAALSASAGQLAHALQDERAAATQVLSDQPNNIDDSSDKKVFNQRANTTQAQITAYGVKAGQRSGLPDNFLTTLSQIDHELSGLDALEKNVVTPEQFGGAGNQGSTSYLPLSAALDRYNVLITNLLSIRDSAAQLAGDQTLIYEMRAASALSAQKEYLQQERVLILQAMLDKKLSPEQRSKFIGFQEGQGQELGSFTQLATPYEASLLDSQVGGEVTGPTEKFEAEIIGRINAGTTSMVNMGFTVGQWDTAMKLRADRMFGVEQMIDQQIEADALTLRNNITRSIILDAGLLFGMVLVAMVITWGVARAMNRSLRELTQGALAVARHGLPQAVARLRDPALSSQLTPAQVALQIAEPLPVRSRDEFGEVTEAFNAVHLEAVRTAAEQAALRASVATMFVNLARRSQILVDRLIGHLDRLERGEENPDRLAELFQLDHLATRMRRNDENLLVLAGADSTRVQREPAPLLDVLRAAQSEVEHYTRIEFGQIDRDLEIAAHAVNDLVHLVAELFDNATAFSPPDSPVLVEARRVGDRAMLYVEDRGIGVSAEQLADLNERLATPPLVDVAVSRMMGLVVVARLAARHGVAVELRPANERGTVADVLLPQSVLVPRGIHAPTTRGQLRDDRAALASEPSRPRSPFGPPLALESGPSRTERPRNGAYPPAVGSGYPSAGGGYPSPGGGYPSSGGMSGGFAAAAESFGPPSAPPAPARPLLGPGAASRALPSWSDLTGAGTASANQPNGRAFPTDTGTNGYGERMAESRAAGFTPLPQRPRPDFDDEPRIPRQRPSAVPMHDDFADAEVVDDYPSRDDAYTSRVEERRPAAPPPSAAPPVWPPVAPAAVDREDTGSFRSPGRVESLDMTAEIPRYRDLDLGGVFRDDRSPAAGAPSVGERAPESPAVPARVASFADETMELPIFRELESAWFSTADAGPREPISRSADDVAAENAVRYATGATTSAYGARGNGSPYAPAATSTDYTTGGNQMAGSVTGQQAPEAGWRTSADDGWAAAAAAAEVPDAGTTEGGLPKRVPMAQLVPGGVEKASQASSHRRSPDAVRGLLSAYHRGVQRGRQQTSEDSDTPESMTSGYPVSGKEQD